MADQPILESLRVTSLLAGRLLDRELAARGVAAEQFALVDEIGRAEPVTPSELARRTGQPPTTLSDHLNRLSRPIGSLWCSFASNPRGHRHAMMGGLSIWFQATWRASTRWRSCWRSWSGCWLTSRSHRTQSDSAWLHSATPS